MSDAGKAFSRLSKVI